MDELLNKLKNMDGWEVINHKIGYINFSICRSALFNGGYTVVSSFKHITEHFSSAERVVEFIKSFAKK